jgi:hypothetical protein
MMFRTTRPDGWGLQSIPYGLGDPKSKGIPYHGIGLYGKMAAMLFDRTHSKNHSGVSLFHSLFDVKGSHVFHTNRSHYPLSFYLEVSFQTLRQTPSQVKPEHSQNSMTSKAVMNGLWALLPASYSADFCFGVNEPGQAKTASSAGWQRNPYRAFLGLVQNDISRV